MTPGGSRFSMVTVVLEVITHIGTVRQRHSQSMLFVPSLNFKLEIS